MVGLVWVSGTLLGPEGSGAAPAAVVVGVGCGFLVVGHLFHVPPAHVLAVGWLCVGFGVGVGVGSCVC